MFYWMLLNIHPAHRSTLRSIQLLAVVKSKTVKKYGIDAALTPAVKDLKTLATTVSNTYFHVGVISDYIIHVYVQLPDIGNYSGIWSQ